MRRASGPRVISPPPDDPWFESGLRNQQPESGHSRIPALDPYLRNQVLEKRFTLGHRRRLDRFLDGSLA